MNVGPVRRPLPPSVRRNERSKLTRSNRSELSLTLILLVLVALATEGCHRSAAATPAPPGEARASDPGGPESALYKKLRSADVLVDSGIRELNEALQGSEKLAPRAGGEAEKALLSVVEQLDQAGESLGDYENAPGTFEEFKKDFSAQDERRLRSIKIVLDADAKTNEAANTLNDLSQNVPDGFKKDLTEIGEGVNEAQSDLEQAVTAMGGQIPDDGVVESVDPAQDATNQSRPNSDRTNSDRTSSDRTSASQPKHDSLRKRP